MMDNGFPFTTEPNILMEMIPRMGTIGKLTGQSSVSEQISDGLTSQTPWRKAGVRYATNEVYFDIVEEMDCQIESNGIASSCEISGEILVECHLSGMPDLTLTLSSPIPFDDISFHPCVRYNKYEQNKVISFVPPDGNFKLMSYRIKGQVQVPLYVKPQISMGPSGGKITIITGSKFTDRKVLDDVLILDPFSKAISNASLTVTQGRAIFDEQTRTLKWSVGKLSPRQNSPQLDGTLTYSSSTPPSDTMPSIQVEFKLNLHSASNISVASLVTDNLSYKPFKGFKALTKSGKFFVKV